MDSFESLIGKLLEEDGFWILHSVKVDLSKDEKAIISKPTTPRPEIDIIALNYKNNNLFLLEIKSYIDSTGVSIKDINIDHKIQQGRFKLLTSTKYREVVSKKLKEELIQKGMIGKSTQISFGLIAGNIKNKEEEDIYKFFREKDWFFWGPSEIKKRLKILSDKSYENNPITMAIKILTRNE